MTPEGFRERLLPEDRLENAFRDAFGMSEAAAKVAARGRDGARRPSTVDLVEAENRELVLAIEGRAEHLRRMSRWV